MIKVTQERDNIFTVELDVPELSMVYQISMGFKMPRVEALKTCISRGLDSTVAVLKEIAEYEKRQRLAQEKEG